MLWKMGFSLPPAQKSKIQNSEHQNADLFDFLMPIFSHYKSQKINISGPGFNASGKHDFSKPGADSKNLTFRFSDSISD